ncbi:MAG TPA: TonB-dependent receptor [Sphingomicrobium sp.]|nr:TonB-dependent receptor [Sphingomicrobium sp.]
MKLDFRQRLLATTLLVSAGAIASPAFGQTPATPPTCPPGVAPGTNGCNPPDNSGVPTSPVTTAPQVGAGVSSTNANGAPTTSAQEIVVTGSRIPQPNLETASPVTTVTSQEVKLQGTTRTEDLINSLPQVFAAQGSDVSNGASGTATVDLRGLGSKRNLVLVNGKRLQAGDTFNPVADIDFIPNQLIKRVDVLTGGASAVYGADAVAGVINFIMDTTFTGFRIDGEASVFQHNNGTDKGILAANAARGFLPPHGNVVNGGAQDIAAMFGSSFDDGRGHVVAYATYRTQDAILESTRDFSFCTLGALPLTAKPGKPSVTTLGRDFNCGGSSTAAQATIFTPTSTFHVQGNSFVPGTVPFNFAPFNYFQRPDERYTLGAFADYEIAPGAHPYLEAMFMDDHTDAQIAPSGDFFNTTTINCDNPLLSTQERNAICTNGTTFVDQNGVTQAIAYLGRRNVEGGARDDDLRHDDFRVVAGMRGDPLRGVSYDVYYQTGQTIRQENFRNDLSSLRLKFALDAVAVDANGNIVAPGTPGATVECRAVVQGNPAAAGCVPFNPFSDGGVTQAQENFLQVPGFEHGVIDENIAHADVTFTGADYGLQTPWSDTGIGLNVGVEYRKESLDFRDDLEQQTGDLSGGGGPIPPVSGHFDVREAFAELQVPIIEHSFIEELALDGGFRKSTYHVGANSFSTNTYKLEARFAPIPDIRFRASYNRAVRAPNIIELFEPAAIGLSPASDPCAGAAPAATLAQCQLSGVTAAQFGHIVDNPAAQFNGLFAGNRNLKPETADTWTAGVILQPRFVPGLAVTVDYFNIKVKNLLGALTFSEVLNGCIGQPPIPQDLTLCPLIHRAPNGSLFLTQNGFVDLTNINQAGLGLQTRGIDLNGTYSHRLGGLGTLNLSFVGTRLLKLENPHFGQDCAGFFSDVCSGPFGTPNPKWRHKARISLTMPNGIGASVAWRYFSQTIAPPSSPAVLKDLVGDLKVPAQSYFDLALTARIQQRLNLRLGVNNIFDKDPPVVGAPAANGNTFPQVFDSLGRFFFAGATVDF